MIEEQQKDLFTKEELSVFLQMAPFHHWLDLQIGEITDDGLEIIMPWRPEIISIRAEIALPQLLALLLQMELRNWITVMPGNTYRLSVKLP